MVTGLSAVSANGPRMDNPRPTNNAQEKEIVLVIWRDVIATSGWEKETDVECPKLTSVGWLISDDEQTVKIATTLDYDGFAEENEPLPVPYGITAFPKGCVVEIRSL